MEEMVTEELLQELFEQTRRYLDHFFDTVNIDPIEKLCTRLKESNGAIFISGIGKSGIIAQKIAVTLSSCGTKAHFLSPVDALHGDIGVISEGDTVVLLSKSGESDELLQLCPALRNKGAFLAAIVSNSTARLIDACDMHVLLPVEKELCPFDLAPTTSAVVQLIFGDLLAIALMRMKHISLAEYTQNHPGGRIGKRLTMKVQDVMLKKALPLCFPNDTLADVLVELTNKKCGCVLIIDELMQLLGIFTDGDLRRSLQLFGAAVLSMPMHEIMTKTPKTIEPTALAYDAMQIMEANQKGAIMILPVVVDQKVVGLVQLHSLVQSGL